VGVAEACNVLEGAGLKKMLLGKARKEQK